MNEQDKPISPLRPLAVIETITRLEELQHLLRGDPRPAEFRLERCGQSPQGYAWFNVVVDLSEPTAAMRTVRSVLSALLDGADRGVVEHFRIVIGADLLRQRDGFGSLDGDTGGGPCIA